MHYSFSLSGRRSPRFHGEGGECTPEAIGFTYFAASHRKATDAGTTGAYAATNCENALSAEHALMIAMMDNSLMHQKDMRDLISATDTVDLSSTILIERSTPLTQSVNKGCGENAPGTHRLGVPKAAMPLARLATGGSRPRQLHRWTMRHLRMESNKADIMWLSWICRLMLDQMHAHHAEKSLASLGNFVGAFGEKGPCSAGGQQGTPSKVLFGERPQCCEHPAKPEVLMMLIVRPRLTHHGSSVISLCGADVEWTRIHITDSTNEAAAFVAATHPWGDGTYVEPNLITASLDMLP